MELTGIPEFKSSGRTHAATGVSLKKATENGFKEGSGTAPEKELYAACSLMQGDYR
jgi:hypothetical protein